MKKKIDYEISSGNVFADLGLSNPEERLAKADLAIQINTLIEQKKLTQKSAAELLDIDQPKVSDLSRGRLAGFSLERLFRFLNILGQDITIKVTPKKKTKRKADVSVSLPIIRRKKIIIQPTRNSPDNAQRKQKARFVDSWAHFFLAMMMCIKR